MVLYDLTIVINILVVDYVMLLNAKQILKYVVTILWSILYQKNNKYTQIFVHIVNMMDLHE